MAKNYNVLYPNMVKVARAAPTFATCIPLDHQHLQTMNITSKYTSREVELSLRVSGTSQGLAFCAVIHRL